MDAKSLKVLLKLKEQIDMVASCEERRLLPDFCIVVVEVKSLGLFFTQQEFLILFFIDSTTTSCCSSISSFSSLLSFVLTFGVSFLIDNSLSPLELLLDFFIRRESTLHPGMGKNFFEFRSVGRVEGHHFLEEVFKLGRVDI